MGFKSRVDILACTLSCLHAVILKVTSGATPAFSTNMGVHCIGMYTAWRPVTFPTCHVCNRGRLPGFNQETSCTVSRRALHLATMTGKAIFILIWWMSSCQAHNNIKGHEQYKSMSFYLGKKIISEASLAALFRNRKFDIHGAQPKHEQRWLEMFKMLQWHWKMLPQLKHWMFTLNMSVLISICMSIYSYSLK